MIHISCLLWVSASVPAFADLADVEAAARKAKNAYDDRFAEFTQDKNVMGRPSRPDGKKVAGKTKSRFNNDDDAPFQSDLTYHDFAYDTNDANFAEKQKDKQKGAKSRTLFAGISSHGPIASGGGSSKLEREAYALHEQFSKEEDDDEKKKKDEEKGIQYRSIFKVETKDVKKQDNGGGAGGQGAPGGQANNKNEPPEKVDRWYIRDEAVGKIEQVGEESFQTVQQAARDADKRDNPQALENMLMLYEAAKRSTVTLYKSTLANLTQARAFLGVPDKIGSGVQLSEDASTPDKWASDVASQQKDKLGAQAAKNAEKDIKEMKEQAEEIITKSYKAIAPRFSEDDKKGGQGKPTLKDEGPKKEEGRERDARVFLNVLSSAGTTAKEVPSNWDYQAKDDKATIAVKFDASGNPIQKSDLTVQEQLDLYNQQLDSAAAAYAKMKEKLPFLQSDPKEITSYKIAPKSKSIPGVYDNVSRSVVEGVETFTPSEALPETYKEMLDQNGK